MQIIDHGKWIPYKPEVLPEGAPSGAIFCKRESDGVDWYAYSHPSANERKRMRLFSSNFQEHSVKIAFTFHESEQRWIIGPAVTDVSLIFPANHFVREITDFGSTDVDRIIEFFQNKVIDPETNELLGDRKEFAPKFNGPTVQDLEVRISQLEHSFQQLAERIK